MRYSVVAPLWQDRPASDNLEVALTADRLKFSELWIGEMATYDAFAFATAAGLRTTQINLNIGPMAVPVRTPLTLAMGAASVADLTGRKVNLALGASSNVVVEKWHGRARARTATHLAECAQIVRGLLLGEKVDFSGRLCSCRGYHLRLDTRDFELTIAAFGPAAVRAAANHADCMLINMVDPDSAARLRQQMDEAAGCAGRPAPRLSLWIACAIDPGPEAIHQILRSKVGYLSAPGYSDMFASAGFGDLVEYARTRPHPKDLLAAMPDELVSAIGLVGSETEIDQRIEAYRAAGVDELCLVPATAGDPGGKKTLEYMSRRLG